MLEGNIGKKIAFLVEGGAVSYFNQEGQNTVNKLWLPQEFIFSSSTFTHMPSEQTFEFRKDSHIIQFSEEVSFYIEYFLAEQIQDFEKHVLWLKEHTSQKRHIYSINKYGRLYLNLTNHEKGSFIGVSERWISKLKNE